MKRGQVVVVQEKDHRTLIEPNWHKVRKCAILLTEYNEEKEALEEEHFLELRVSFGRGLVTQYTKGPNGVWTPTDVKFRFAPKALSQK